MNSEFPWLLFLVFLIMVIYLIIESRIHSKQLRRIPFRISVSGTRGKTTIVRLLAAVLRESGHRVLAKTTGSEALYILPDGSEEIVKRSFQPNIIEQKKLVRKGASLGVEYLITEIMSIQSENHRVETRKLIKPDITLITNTYPDHIDAGGRSEREMVLLYENDANRGSRLIVPEIFSQALRRYSKILKSSVVHVAETNLYRKFLADHAHSQQIYPEQLDLICKTAELLEIDPENLEIGLKKSHMDIGKPSIFEFNHHKGKHLFINGFAANDPLSSQRLIDQTRKLSRMTDAPFATLLILRKDRPERSKQWLRYFTEYPDKYGEILFIMGLHASVFQRKLADVKVLRSIDPKTITETMMNDLKSDCMVFGLGNIKGPGQALNEYWQTMGKEIQL